VLGEIVKSVPAKGDNYRQ